MALESPNVLTQEEAFGRGLAQPVLRRRGPPGRWPKHWVRAEPLNLCVALPLALLLPIFVCGHPAPPGLASLRWGASKPDPLPDLPHSTGFSSTCIVHSEIFANCFYFCLLEYILKSQTQLPLGPSQCCNWLEQLEAGDCWRQSAECAHGRELPSHFAISRNCWWSFQT